MFKPKKEEKNLHGIWNMFQNKNYIPTLPTINPNLIIPKTKYTIVHESIWH
jgi:hypothetical protein